MRFLRVLPSVQASDYEPSCVGYGRSIRGNSNVLKVVLTRIRLACCILFHKDGLFLFLSTSNFLCTMKNLALDLKTSKNRFFSSKDEDLCFSIGFCVGAAYPRSWVQRTFVMPYDTNTQRRFFRKHTRHPRMLGRQLEGQQR